MVRDDNRELDRYIDEKLDKELDRELDRELNRKRNEKLNRATDKSTKKAIGKGKRVVNSYVMIFLYVTIAMLFIAGGFIYVVSRVKTDIQIEAGEKFDAKDIWNGGGQPAVVISEEMDTTSLGQHKCKVKVFGVFPVEIEVLVADTKAPKVAVKEVIGNYGVECDPESFVLNYDDATNGVYSYVKKPDFNHVGTQDVIINVCDEGGNNVNVASKLTIRQVADTITIDVGSGVPDAKKFVSVGEAEVEYVTAPVAEQLKKIGRYNVKLKVNGSIMDAAILVVDKTPPVIKTSSIEVILNSNVSYKKEIEVSDNYDVAAAIVVNVDNSKVNLASVGYYTLVCTATDTSGNQVKKEIGVSVVDSVSVKHTQEEIDKLADAVLAKIINNSMTAKQKAQAIYTYTRSNISYKVNREKGDWLQGAYDGLASKNGDCFTFCATARALLTRAGIKNSVIQKEITANTSQTNHYWNIIDIGDGWYHFDTTPRMDGTQFFMWTDARLKAYSDSHSGSHNFTRSKYPKLK